MSCLWSLDINPLLVTSLVNIFSHSVGVFLLVVSFAVQKHQFKQVSFVYFPLLWETDLRKHCYDLSEDVLPGSSPRSFMSCLIFRSLNNFEFIFVRGVRECSHFSDLCVAVQLPQCPLLLRLSFLHCVFLPPLAQLTMDVWVDFWALLCSIGPYVWFCTIMF